MVEDEAAARAFLVELLEGAGLSVVAAVEDEAEAETVLEPETGVRVDVAFVDIQLTGSLDAEEAGLRLVRKHAERPGAPAFVLCTANREHALEAYGLGVVDYLVKPVSRRRVAACIERISGRLQPSSDRGGHRVVARSRRGLVFFEQSEVLAFKAEGRLVEVLTASGAYGVDLTLNGLERSLGPNFLRVHRNYLVNGPHVRGLEREDGEMRLSVGEHAVPVARDRQPEVRRRLLADAFGIKGAG